MPSPVAAVELRQSSPGVADSSEQAADARRAAAADEVLAPEPEPVPRGRRPAARVQRPSSAASTPSWPAHPTWPPPRPANAIEPVESRAPRLAAGAYLPPSAVLPPGDALPLAAAAERRDVPASRRSRPRARTSASRRSQLRLGEGTGPLGMPADAPTRIVVLGAAIAGLGFLLPWADIVIGSSAIGGYLAQWGLAGPGHVIVLALVVGLAVAGPRSPSGCRAGSGSGCRRSPWPACSPGSLWPYLVGPFNASIGVYVVAVGAIVMIAGGLLDRIATRHAEAAATV